MPKIGEDGGCHSNIPHPRANVTNVTFLGGGYFSSTPRSRTHTGLRLPLTLKKLRGNKNLAQVNRFLKKLTFYVGPQKLSFLDHL